MTDEKPTETGGNVRCNDCKDGADLLPGESCGSCKLRRVTVTEVCAVMDDWDGR